MFEIFRTIDKKLLKISHRVRNDLKKNSSGLPFSFGFIESTIDLRPDPAPVIKMYGHTNENGKEFIYPIHQLAIRRAASVAANADRPNLVRVDFNVIYAEKRFGFNKPRNV